VRYFYLVTINAYLREELARNYTKPFNVWLKERPEISRILDNIQYPEAVPDAV
jgi:hypothetical protein